MPSDLARLTTASLLDGLRNQDDAQWKRFVFTFGPIVLAWIKKSGVPATDVDDLAQDVFLAASTGLDHYRHDAEVKGSLRRWLWGITRNKLATHFSKIKNTPHAAGGSTAQKMVSELPDVPYEELDATLDSVRKDIATRALNMMRTDFAERTWQAFWQSAVEGHPTKEIAKRLEMSHNQVRQSRSRVLRRLRSEFGTDIDLLQQ